VGFTTRMPRAQPDLKQGQRLLPVLSVGQSSRIPRIALRPSRQSSQSLRRVGSYGFRGATSSIRVLISRNSSMAAAGPH
jgi:hypothetical protein